MRDRRRTAVFILLASSFSVAPRCEIVAPLQVVALRVHGCALGLGGFRIRPRLVAPILGRISLPLWVGRRGVVTLVPCVHAHECLPSFDESWMMRRKSQA